MYGHGQPFLGFTVRKQRGGCARPRHQQWGWPASVAPQVCCGMRVARDPNAPSVTRPPLQLGQLGMTGLSR
eukprot:199588-Chlamydomonas_euryale.AAC.3